MFLPTNLHTDQYKKIKAIRIFYLTLLLYLFSAIVLLSILGILKFVTSERYPGAEQLNLWLTPSFISALTVIADWLFASTPFFALLLLPALKFSTVLCPACGYQFFVKPNPGSDPVEPQSGLPNFSAKCGHCSKPIPNK